MAKPGTMTLAKLQKLIADSKGEWEQIEFKKSTGELQGGMETLCGFLNGSGGKVLFGVTTAGKVQGQDVSDSTFQEVANAIRKLEPPARIEQTRIPVGGTKEVLMRLEPMEVYILDCFRERADQPVDFFLRRLGPRNRIGAGQSRKILPEAVPGNESMKLVRRIKVGIIVVPSTHVGTGSGHARPLPEWLEQSIVIQI